MSRVPRRLSEFYVHALAQRRVRRVATPERVSSPSQRLRVARNPAQIELSRLSGSSQVTGLTCRVPRRLKEALVFGRQLPELIGAPCP